MLPSALVNRLPKCTSTSSVVGSLPRTPCTWSGPPTSGNLALINKVTRHGYNAGGANAPASEHMSPLNIRNATKSLPHHIFLLWIYFSLPLALLFVAFSYEDHELTLLRILWVLAVCTCAGVFVAIAGWYVIVPSIRRGPKR